MPPNKPDVQLNWTGEAQTSGTWSIDVVLNEYPWTNDKCTPIATMFLAQRDAKGQPAVGSLTGELDFMEYGRGRMPAMWRNCWSKADDKWCKINDGQSGVGLNQTDFKPDGPFNITAVCDVKDNAQTCRVTYKNKSDTTSTCSSPDCFTQVFAQGGPP